MTTPNTDLVEQIARALFDHEHRHMRPEWRERAWTTSRTLSDRAHFLARAAAVLPIVDAAVKAGKAVGFHEGQVSGWRSAREESEMNGMVGDFYDLHTETEPNPYEETPDEQ